MRFCTTSCLCNDIQPCTNPVRRLIPCTTSCRGRPPSPITNTHGNLMAPDHNATWGAGTTSMLFVWETCTGVTVSTVRGGTACRLEPRLTLDVWYVGRARVCCCQGRYRGDSHCQSVSVCVGCSCNVHLLFACAVCITQSQTPLSQSLLMHHTDPVREAAGHAAHLWGRLRSI